MKKRLPAYLEAALFILLTAAVAWRIAADRSTETLTESAAELLRQADEAYESSDMAEAAALYQDVLKRHPDNLRSRAQLARIGESAAELLKLADEAYRSDNIADAATLYHDVLKRDPDNSRSRAQLTRFAKSAEQLLKMADEAYSRVDPETSKPSPDMAGAAALYNDVLKRDPGNLRSRVQLARIFLLNNWNSNAIQLLDEVLARDPDHLNARLLYGDIHRIEGRSEEAAAMYVEALRDDPDNAKAHYYLGTAYHADSNFTEALRSYRRAIESDKELKTPPMENAPYGVQAHLQIGRAYRQLARFHRREAADAERKGDAEAAAYARMISKRRSDRALIELRGAYEKFLQAGLEVEEYGAAPRELTSALAEKALEMRRNREPETDILRVYQEIVQIDPDDIDAWLEAGRILSLTAQTIEEYEEMYRHFDAAYNLDPNDIDARVGMAEAEQEIERLKGESETP